jgi:hypothetical protein
MTYKWLKVGISAAKVPSKIDQFKTLTGLSDLRPELKPSASPSAGELSQGSTRPSPASSED